MAREHRRYRRINHTHIVVVINSVINIVFGHSTKWNKRVKPKNLLDVCIVFLVECTWSVEVHTRRSTLLEVCDTLKVNVCSIRQNKL